MSYPIGSAKRKADGSTASASPALTWLRPSSACGDSHPAVSAPANSGWSASHPCSILRDKLLVQAYEDMLVSTVDAHRSSTQPRPVLNKKRKEDMRMSAFNSTLNTLERAYTKLLHSNLEDELTQEMGAEVRDLSIAIEHELQQHTPVSSDEGSQVLRNMMEHVLYEFSWSQIEEVLQEAADIARDRKAAAYADATSCRRRLKALRQPQQGMFMAS